MSGAPYALRFRFAIRLTQPRQVEKDVELTVNVQWDFTNVARGAGFICHNGNVGSRQSIEQAGFSGIRGARERHANTFAHHATMLGRCQRQTDIALKGRNAGASARRSSS